MATTDLKNIIENIAIVEKLIPTVPANEVPYYNRVLGDLYQKRAEQHRQSGHAHTDYTRSPYGTQVPSPPQAEPSHGRKRSIGPAAAYPEAKRYSGQPSPVTPESDDSRLWSRRQIASRPAIQDHFVVDLTESDPPTPERISSSYRPIQPRAPTILDSFSNSFADPFEELNAYPDEQMAPADAFNQDFMLRDALAELMMTSTAPGNGYGYQQKQLGLNQPAPWAGDDSDRGDYGTFPLNASEADAIEKLFDNIKDDGETPAEREDTPSNMTCILKEYQKIGLTWLLKMERGTSKGGILADEMGLGKTIQALALICANSSPDPRYKTTLIIAPVALMRQWQKEIETHVSPRHKLSVHLYHGSGKNADFARLRRFDVVLTTFGTLTSEFKQRESALEGMRRDQGSRKAKDTLALLGHECMWYRVIIDEAHNIKNRLSQCSKACAELMAKHRLCMTGTPMMNSIDELFPLLRFLRVEPYISWPKFSIEIARPAKNSKTQERAMKRVQILLRSVMLRRQKNSMVDGKPISVLPPKYTIIDNVEFEDDEHALYKALETKSQLQLNKYLQKDTVAGNVPKLVEACRLVYESVLTVSSQLRQRPRIVAPPPSGLLPPSSHQGFESARDRRHRGGRSLSSR
jgi:hypothetical protein